MKLFNIFFPFWCCRKIKVLIIDDLEQYKKPSKDFPMLFNTYLDYLDNQEEKEEELKYGNHSTHFQ